MGHEDQFQPPRLSGGYRFGEGTFAEIDGSGRDVPIAAIGTTEHCLPLKGYSGAPSELRHSAICICAFPLP